MATAQLVQTLGPLADRFRNGRHKQWIFRLGNETHKVEFRQQLMRDVCVTVDGHELQWELGILDHLDFGGHFSFSIHGEDAERRPVSYVCTLMLTMVHAYLYVDGVNIETGDSSMYSVGRTVIRIFALAGAALLFATTLRVAST